MATKVYPDQLRATKIDDTTSSIGSGFAWPPKISDEGTVHPVTGLDHVKACIQRVISYNHGDLTGVFSFGGCLPSKVHGVDGISTHTLSIEQIKEAIENYEKRVTNVRVTAGRSTDINYGMSVIVQYELNITGVDESLVFPIPKE